MPSAQLTISPLFVMIIGLNSSRAPRCALPLSRGRAAAARVAHNHKVGGSSPPPATKKDFPDRDWFQNQSLLV